MVRRVYLHIGTMKSGTKYLQEFCNLNRELLAGSGLLWTAGVQNFRALDDLLQIRKDFPFAQGAWARLNNRLHNHSGDALISNELLAALNAEKLEKLLTALAPAEVHVIITARDFAKVLPSHWQEGARNSDTTTWSDFISAVRGDDDSNAKVGRNFWARQGVAGIVRRWSAQVPIDRITVVTIPKRPQSPLGLVERFFMAMGFELPADVQQPTYLHEKMGAASTELMRRINERSEFDWYHHQWGLKQSLARYVLATRADREPSIQLDSRQRAWACSRAAAMVQGIADTQVRVIGDLDDLVPDPNGPSATADPSESTDAELLDAAIDGILGLGRILADTRIEFDALRDSVEAALPELSAEEQARFDATSLGDVPAGVPLGGRLVSWRLRHGAREPFAPVADDCETGDLTRIDP